MRGTRERRPVELGVLLLALLVLISIQQAPFTVHSTPRILHVPQEYSTIQSAIDAASPGDTVLVDSGMYGGNLTITKSLNLTGVSASTTIIDAGGLAPDINITATSNVVVSGFTIKNPGGFASEVIVASSSTVTISDNVVQTGSTYGTYLNNSQLVTVRNNQFSGNSYGVVVQGGHSNIIHQNNMTTTVQVAIYNSTGNIISDNVLRQGQTGIDLRDGSTGNVVARNTIANETLRGLSLQNSYNNTILENNIEFNKQSSTTIGIYFQTARGNRLYYNNIRNNTIQFFPTSVPGDIAGNTWNDGGGSPRGNFWVDYKGQDDGSNGRVAGDGIGDSLIPHPCPSGGPPCWSSGLCPNATVCPPGVDDYALVQPFALPPVKLTASASPLSGYAPLLVSFKANPSGGAPPYTYSWDFGDGAVAQQQNTTHTYPLKGSYVASVRVTDSVGTNQTDSIAVTVLARYGSLVLHVQDQTQKPVGGANVTTIAQPSGQSRLAQRTNPQGIAAWVNLTPGNYSFQVSSPGFEPATKSVVVVFNQTTNAQVTLVTPATQSGFPVLTTVGLGLVVVLGILAGFFLRRRSRRKKPGDMSVSGSGKAALRKGAGFSPREI